MLGARYDAAAPPPRAQTADFGVLGTCKSITISKDDTVMLDGAGEKESIEERCELLRESIAETGSEYEKEKLQACRATPHQVTPDPPPPPPSTLTRGLGP